MKEEKRVVDFNTYLKPVHLHRESLRAFRGP